MYAARGSHNLASQVPSQSPEFPLYADQVARHEIKPGRHAAITLDASKPLHTYEQPDGTQLAVIADVKPIAAGGDYSETQRQGGRGVYVGIAPEKPGQVTYLEYAQNGEEIVTVTTQPIPRQPLKQQKQLPTAIPSFEITPLYTAGDTKTGTPPTLHLYGQRLTALGSRRTIDEPTFRITTQPGICSVSSEDTWGDHIDESVRLSDRRFRRITASMATIAAGAYMAIVPGGLVDERLDAQRDAGAVVQEHFAGTTTDPEMNASVSRIGTVMHNLDTHNDKPIIDEANRYRQTYRGQLLGQEAIKELTHDVDTAVTTDGVIGIADSFMHRFGKRAELLTADKVVAPTEKTTKNSSLRTINPYDSDRVPLDKLKYAAKATIAELSVFPTSYLETLPFSAIQYGMYAKGSKTAGLHIADGDRTRIQVAVDNMQEGTVAHETGHDMAGAEDVSTGSDWISDGLGMSDRIESTVDKTILDSPDYVSNYAHYGGDDEMLAENFANATDIDMKGLAHPDHARRFGSKSNLGILDMLMRIERKLPGFTANQVVRAGLLKSTAQKPWFGKLIAMARGNSDS